MDTSPSFNPTRRLSTLLVTGLTAGMIACASPRAQSPAPVVQGRVKAVLDVDGSRFRDLNGSGTLDPYEDWRRPVPERIDDLVGRMTPPEKAGMMLIQTLNAAAGGELPPNATSFVRDEHMTRFIFRNQVVTDPVASPGGFQGSQITPRQAAEFMNRVQVLAESTRLGIPLLFKSNARNHYEQDARPGINVAAGAFSVWPKEAGLAATRDLALIGEFADTVRLEWTSVGIRGLYGYMADLTTEPRWYRDHETFTEDADLASDIIRTLVIGLQGKTLGPGSVAVTIKHFPGGGPQDGGADPHYYFGRHQVYPTNNFDYHVRPFKAAIDAGAAAIMPYYGIPIGQRYLPNDVTSGDHADDVPRPPVPEGTRYALLRVTVTNPVQPLDRASHPHEPQPMPGREPSTFFGGALPDEIDALAFSDMARARSWKITPSLDDIQAVMRDVGAANTVLAVYFRQPYVLDDASGLKQAGAIVALFGASDAALMDVLTGKYLPTGRLPFALANSAGAIVRQAPDAPGYSTEDTLFPFGFGLDLERTRRPVAVPATPVPH